ncbi:MAG: hypothetical protein AAF823_10290 [Planctomycetota bacterium]
MKLFGRNKSVAVDAVTFDTNGWRRRDQSATHRRWKSKNGTNVVLRYHQPTPALPFDFRFIKNARAYYDDVAGQRAGAMLSLDFVKARGIPSVRGVFKYRCPKGTTDGKIFAGMILLPYRDFAFQIDLESPVCLDNNPREAAAIANGEGPAGNQADPFFVRNADELFAMMSDTCVKPIPADHERYDAAFPDHPLTRLRADQLRILKSLSLHDAIKDALPYYCQ